MDARQLECFLAVVDYGSVTRAATVLHLAQPSLSQIIRRLERDLKTELFQRVGRGLLLTPAGEAIVGPSRQVLRDLSAVRDVAHGFQGLAAGRLDVACSPSLARDFISEWVGAFRRLYPGMGVRVDLLEDPADIADRLRAGDYELGYSTARVTREGVVSRELTGQNIVVALPPGTGSSLPEPVGLPALAEVPFVVVRRMGADSLDIIELLAEHALRPRVVVEVNDDTSLVPLVLSGAGAAFIPLRLALEAGRRGATVRSTVPALSRPLFVLHREGVLSRAAQAFLDLNLRQLQRWFAAVEARQAAGLSLLESAAATDERIVSAYGRPAVPADTAGSAGAVTMPSASRRSRSRRS